MPKFDMSWLFSSIFLLSILLAIAQQNVGVAYLLSCVILPCFVSAASRLILGTSSLSSIAIVMTTAVGLGSGLMAFGSFCYTFVTPTSGYLVGDGWSSVFAAGLIGAVFGCLCGFVSFVPYVIFENFIRPKDDVD